MTTSPLKVEESRAQFEAWVREEFGDLIDRRVCKNGDREYMAWDMQVAWRAWTASRAAGITVKGEG